MTARLANPKSVGARGVMNVDRAATIAAKRLGIDPEEYKARRASGEKWCWGCQKWHSLDQFPADKNQRDGCKNICRAAFNLRYQYVHPLSLSEGGTFGRRWDEAIVDPATVIDYAEIDAAERLRRIVGDMDPDDVRLLDSASLARLQDRLRDEGLTPRTVQKAERDRLQLPDRHSGGGVVKATKITTRRKRAHKVAHKAANRARGNSNRPSQKPRDDIRTLRRARQSERAAWETAAQ